ncbi:hypothetical protein [Pseudomonas asplenii]|uniref:Uncharacterized protein n=1 Tax=Pseudomonas asplenii TaxID=53407 RepID=A0A1H6LL47_9PSED|nr:hypothetical protein [Pseudomonas fuscovaginae]SEH86109.1 hypothetical protein SAMN05216581_0179 [Pseudomonas fuscovaginae]
MIIARMLALLLLVCLAAASVAVSAAPSAAAELTTEAYVLRLVQATRTAWPELARYHQTTRVFARIQLLASDGRRAWVMDAQGGREVEMAKVRDLGVSYEYQRYRKLLWRGRPAIFIGLGEAPPASERQRLKDPLAVPELFSLATHEAFHFYVEADWLPLPGAERSISYPASAEPRLYRNRIIHQLLAAVQGRSEGLAQASYWYRRWLDEHAEEVQRLRQTDRSEGSARHVESIANLLARGLHPRSAEGAQLMLEALAHQAQTDFLAADLESYVLGDLAGYLLERQGVDWLARMAQGETPLAMLLESVTPVAAPADEAMERRIRKAIAAANRQAAQAFEPFLQRFHDPAGGHLLVPNRAMSGSFEVSNSYRLTTQPGTIEVGVSAGFALADGRIDLRAATVATQLKSACGREDLYWIVALAPAELEKTAEGRLRLERADLTLDIPYPQRSVEAPRSWCVAT